MKSFIVSILILVTTCFLFNSCQNEVSVNDSNIAELRASVKILQGRCDSLAIALANTNLNVANLKKTVDSIKIQLGNLTTQLNSTNANIKVINAQLLLLSQQYADLLAKLNAINSNNPFKFNLTMYYAGPDSLSSFATVYDTAKWHYVAITIDSNRETIIYIDGTKKVDYYRENVPYNYSTVYLGTSFYTSFGGFFKGAIDELRISNIVRKQVEIQDYYTRSIIGTIGTLPDATQTSDNNTIGLWHFDETGGSSFVNQVPNTPLGVLKGSSKFIAGKAGNSIFFDGTTGYGNCNISLPSSPLTFEFWFKTNDVRGSTIVQPYGLYSSNISLQP